MTDYTVFAPLAQSHMGDRGLSAQLHMVECDLYWSGYDRAEENHVYVKSVGLIVSFQSRSIVLLYS